MECEKSNSNLTEILFNQNLALITSVTRKNGLRQDLD